MERLKLFLGSVAIVTVLVGGTLLLFRVVGEREVNEKWAYYGRLEAAIHDQCIAGSTKQFDKAAVLIVKANREIEEHRQLNRSGLIGDLLIPDGWDSVGYISIPTEMECVRIRRESRIRQCELFVREGWEDIFHREGCVELLAAVR